MSFLAAGESVPGCSGCLHSGHALLLCRKPQPSGGACNIAVADGVPLLHWDGAKTFLKVCLCRNYPIHKERFPHLPLSPLHKKRPVLLSCPSPTALSDLFPSTNTTQPQQGKDLDPGFPLPGRAGIMMQMVKFLLVEKCDQPSVVGLPWLDARCPPKPLYHSPPQLDRGEKI